MPLFPDHFRSLMTRCFAHQNDDGGLPETFPGTRSGCWTSSEIYAAIAGLGLEEFCPTGAVQRLEEYLIAVCRRHDGRGLPYYEVSAPDGSTLSDCMVEASASLCMGLQARQPDSPLIDSIAQWLIRTQAATGGWGIAEGEPVRVYSSAYALMALEYLDHDDVVASGRRWLWSQSRDGQSGRWWSFRPGVDVPSALMTAMAVSALRPQPESRDTQQIVRFLLNEVERPAMVEEDEFPTRRGLKLSFLYSPRLASLSALLSMMHGQTNPRAHNSVDMDRALRALASYAYASQRTGRPAVDLPDERLWHYIELCWGYGGVRAALGRLGERAVRRYAEHERAVRHELARTHIVQQAPPPLAVLVSRCWDQAELPGERLQQLIGITEVSCRLARARMAALLLRSQHPETVEIALTKAHPGAGTTLRQLWKPLKAASFEGQPSGIHDQHHALMAQVRALTPALNRWLATRNRQAHGGPSTPSGRQRAADRWDALVLEVLEAFDALLMPPLLTMERVGLPRQARGFVYRARVHAGAHAKQETHLLATDLRLPDHVEVVAETADGAQSRISASCVYSGDPSQHQPEEILAISPFVLRLRCPSCDERHFFLLVGSAPSASPDKGTSDQHQPLLMQAPRCGEELVIYWPMNASS